MTLAAQIPADNAVFFNTDDFGTVAKYNSKDGSIVSATITVLLDYAADLGGAAYGQADMVSIWLKASDVPRPAVYDSITIGSATYIVRTRARGDKDVFQVFADTDQRQNGGIL